MTGKEMIKKEVFKLVKNLEPLFFDTQLGKTGSRMTVVWSFEKRSSLCSLSQKRKKDFQAIQCGRSYRS